MEPSQLAVEERSVPSDTEDPAVLRRMEEWRALYRPSNGLEEWLYRQLVRNAVRMDICERDELALRRYSAIRAQLCWDADRRGEIEEIAAKLEKEPGKTTVWLQRSRHGCEWLIERWQVLGRILDRGGSWTDAQESLALDMLGMPADMRPYPFKDALHAVVKDEIARLEALKANSLDAIDELRREEAATGRPYEPERALAAILRYEATCLGRFQWARKLLLESQAANAPAAPTSSAPPTSPSRSEPAPVPDPVVPFPRDAFADIRPDFETFRRFESPRVESSAPPAAPASSPTRLITPSLPASVGSNSSTGGMNRRQRRAAQKRAGR